MSPQQQQAQRTLRDLIAKYRKLSDSERKTLSEANVVAQFIQPLLNALGWPTGDPARFKYELHTHGGRPDMTLFPDEGGTLFVEAKRFGVVQELAEARKTLAGTITPGQLALPGMATDRTAEEQQAINYAFTNGGTWAILTNFEKLRLFNARRDWLVLSFERPEAYLDEFDLLWQIAYPSILDGDLERLSNQRHREDVDTEYLNFINGWRERLAQDIVAHPQRNPWAFRDSERRDPRRPAAHGGAAAARSARGRALCRGSQRHPRWHAAANLRPCPQQPLHLPALPVVPAALPPLRRIPQLRALCPPRPPTRPCSAIPCWPGW